MSRVELNFHPAADLIDPDDFRNVLKVLSACGPETAIPAIREIYKGLIENLGTFGSCVVATALFVAYMNKRGGNWSARLVEDPEFPENHDLRTHWVAVDLDQNGSFAVDVTVADQEKDMVALGSDMEREAAQAHLEDAGLLGRLQAGLNKFTDDEDGSPLLPGLTAKDLLTVYENVRLEKAVRPIGRLRVVPLAVLSRK